jgi:hypothetical protein
MNLRASPGMQRAQAAAYVYTQVMLRLGVRVRAGIWPAYVECTYCGGPHKRSQCSWPLSQRNNQEVP